MRNLRETVTTASPGTRFFLQKKFDRALDAEVAAAITKCVEQSRQCLDACARESAAIPVQPPTAHGKSADMVLNAAYLVDEKALDAFRCALAALRTESAALGFSYDLTGPWPPYHFVTPGQEGIEDEHGPIHRNELGLSESFSTARSTRVWSCGAMPRFRWPASI